MALSSMTGFARGQGVTGSYVWNWELKSVNAKGLDVRLRLPPGWDAVEVAVRKAATDALARGTVYGNLSVERKGMAPTVKINEPVLSAIIATLDQIDNRVVGAGRPTLDGILALKGVIEVTEDDEKPEERVAAEKAIIAGFGKTLADLVAMRPNVRNLLGIDPNWQYMATGAVIVVAVELDVVRGHLERRFRSLQAVSGS